jgi:hypothetical protein
LDSDFGATGTLQQPFGAMACAMAIAGQHACAAGATGAVTQQAGRPAASTGANASAARTHEASRLRFNMGARQVKIPAEVPRGKRSRRGE